MIGDGLLDGDYVVVARQQTAVNGDLVVALIGEEATIKRFYLEAEMVRLQPSNPVFQPILLRDVTILGKVIASYRVY
jgi:repressor LexA